jgi:voltage-gated potassium channel Kch
MAERNDLQDGVIMRLVARRAEKRGLRPRVAAGVLAMLWLVAIAIFGILEHLVDPDTFGSVGYGMWWATQTVTTVGYGDVVPTDTASRLVASVLMIGGLSLFAVITGVITSAFVARAQAEQREKDDLESPPADIGPQLDAIRADIAELSARLSQGRSGP